MRPTLVFIRAHYIDGRLAALAGRGSAAGHVQRRKPSTGRWTNATSPNDARAPAAFIDFCTASAGARNRSS